MPRAALAQLGSFIALLVVTLPGTQALALTAGAITGSPLAHVAVATALGCGVAWIAAEHARPC